MTKMNSEMDTRMLNQDTPALKAEARNLNFFYGQAQALKNINMPIYDKKVTALIGPSGCGKSTYLRSFNRMHDLYPGNRYEGEIRFYPDNTNLLASDVDPIEVRMRIGMVFQKPNPFPKSIFENVAYGPRIHGLASSKTDVEEIVVASLKKAGLFEEVKDRRERMADRTLAAVQARLVGGGQVAVLGLVLGLLPPGRERPEVEREGGVLGQRGVEEVHR